MLDSKKEGRLNQRNLQISFLLVSQEFQPHISTLRSTRGASGGKKEDAFFSTHVCDCDTHYRFLYMYVSQEGGEVNRANSGRLELSVFLLLLLFVRMV